LGFSSIRRPPRWTDRAKRVHFEVGHAEHVLARRPTPQHRAQAGRELGERERLDHVVVRPAVEAGNAVVQGVLRRQDDDGQRGLARPDVAQDLETGAARQHQVEDDGVVVDGTRLLPGHGAFPQDVDGVPFLGEAALDETGDLVIVFDYEDAHVRLTRSL
jgi:hypothetical protein